MRLEEYLEHHLQFISIFLENDSNTEINSSRIEGYPIEAY